jgi:aryl-alcohol dehydrogenase-like predicted oxidoreductase
LLLGVACRIYLVVAIGPLAQPSDLSAMILSSLAWLLAQKPWIIPIPGTTRFHRVEENIGAADLELNADDLREISASLAKIEIQGERLPEAALKMTGL